MVFSGGMFDRFVHGTMTWESFHHWETKMTPMTWLILLMAEILHHQTDG
jgi:hypothetical protein